MKIKGTNILIFGVVAASFLILSSAAAVPNVQYASIKNSSMYAQDHNTHLLRLIDEISTVFNLNDDQIATLDVVLNQSNFPLVMYYANDTAFYQYHPVNNTLQTLIEGDVRDIINSCCSWTTPEDTIIVALNQDEDSPDWTQQYDPPG